jgi:adenylosuccinate lyase
MIEINTLTAISPIDGRYRDKVNALGEYFSEAALIKYRILVEVEYFIALCEIPLAALKDFPEAHYESLRALYKNFDINDAIRAKEIEAITNHDVKAIEYLIKEKFDALGLQEYKEYIHFGLTSQDITATPFLLRDAVDAHYYPLLQEIIDTLNTKAEEWDTIPMLAHTHGQPASPTRLGKEIKVFAERLEKQLRLIQDVPCSAKFGGATGNFNAHHVSFPAVNWREFGNTFVNDILGLDRSQTTTQIEHYDNMAALFDGMKRINTILIDFDRDLWTYISMEYFKQKIKAGEVGSSAMPHKVNPIDFENSEGNLGLANAIFEHLSAKLPISRLQRDLTDSTVLRNIGVPLGHTILAFKSLLKGVGKLVVNHKAIRDDLEKNWVVVAEAIQTILRRENYPNPYEALKDLTRTNQEINAETFSQFVASLSVSDAVKTELLQISPLNYTGI